jgi:RNA polymerase sigma-70 factor (ECF subfamily)
MKGHASLRLAGGTAVAPADRRAEVSDADSASFETVRPRLFGIACRVLGDKTEAEDVVQDAWIRWQTTDRRAVRDAPAFLATTATRLAIHVIQSARARRETFAGAQDAEATDHGADPWCDVERREELDIALHALLEKLSPNERAAYLLREAFDYPYRELGRLVGAAERERLLNVFMAAAQAGDLAHLERLLSDDPAARVAA